jgi:hypothetical protein
MEPHRQQAPTPIGLATVHEIVLKVLRQAHQLRQRPPSYKTFVEEIRVDQRDATTELSLSGR